MARAPLPEAPLKARESCFGPRKTNLQLGDEVGGDHRGDRALGE